MNDWIEFDHRRRIEFDDNAPIRHHVRTVARTPSGGDCGADLPRRHNERYDHAGGAMSRGGTRAQTHGAYR